MPSYTGVIERVHSTELDEEDRFGNTYRTSIKLDDGEWYGLGGGKKPDVSIKHNGGWHTLAEGDTVEVVYKVNGKYRNAKRSTLTLEEAGEGGGSSNQSSNRGSGSSGSVAGKGGAARSGGNQLAGIKVGHALNNAVNLAIAEKDLSLSNIRLNAENIIRLSAELEADFDNITADPAPVADNAKTEKPKRKAPAKKKAEPEPEPEDDDDRFDDDVPF